MFSEFRRRLVLILPAILAGCSDPQPAPRDPRAKIDLDLDAPAKR